MQSNRTPPDRVHVVQRPQNDDANLRGPEIVKTLAQINDRLKRSEAERYELLAELREYRKALSALEDKTEMSEKAYITLEHKIQTRDKTDSEITQRQARFEKTLKETEEKLVKSVAGQALIANKIKESEDRNTALAVRMDESIATQTRLDRQLEKVADDKSRMLRKVERLEEVIQETQDSLRARAMVLLTDQSMAAQSGLPQLPAWSAEAAADAAQEGQPWWRKSIRMQSVGMGAMIAAALLLGWTINQVQQPEVPQIAMLENGGLAKLNFDENRWEPLAATDAQNAPVVDDPAMTQALDETAAVEPAAGDRNLTETVQATPAPETQTQDDDQALMDAMEANPDAVAAQLNALEPGAATTPVIETPLVETPVAPQSKASTLMPDFDSVAFNQPSEESRAVDAEKDSRPLTERMQPDGSLPASIKSIENQAFAGSAEAQHDLAAIYTAGHSSVAQNFEKAAFWFREAANGGIANGRYNLGVLYHQGLGVQRDLGRALFWYREAAKLNHPEAQYNLGIAHIEGIGTDYDPLLAAAYFERAANQGIMEAAYNLGLIYENGLLGEAKPHDALLWYKTAADQGSPDAKQALKTLANTLKLSDAEVDMTVAKMREANGLPAVPIKASTR